MRSVSTASLFVAAALAVPSGAWAQSAGAISARGIVSTTVSGQHLTITYGRPSVRGRKIMGGLVPYGKVWRTGADEATTLFTQASLTFGGVNVPAGAYSLFTIPDASGWTFIINKATTPWGGSRAFRYSKKKDVVRTPMKVRTLSTPVELFTISIETNDGNSGVIKLAWEYTEASVDITVH